MSKSEIAKAAETARRLTLEGKFGEAAKKGAEGQAQGKRSESRILGTKLVWLTKITTLTPEEITKLEAGGLHVPTHSDVKGVIKGKTLIGLNITDANGDTKTVLFKNILKKL